MEIEIKHYQEKYLTEMIKIWNEIVEEGIAFPQEKFLTVQTGKQFFDGQTYTGVAVNSDTKNVCGLYILHPNNLGRCGHICNASYAVSSESRGLGIGKSLVLDSLIQGKKYGFRVLQLNAVVKTNLSARHLYENLRFVQLGTIPAGFRLKNGRYEDICLYYRELNDV